MVITINDVTPFKDDWDCPKVIDRKDEIKQLYDHVFNYLIDTTRMPASLGVCGGSGSGKTFVITKKIQEIQAIIKQKRPCFEYRYINLRNQGIPSFYTMLLVLAKSLEKFLPITIKGLGNVEQIQLKGWDKTLLLIVIKEIIEQNKMGLLLVIDEVDRLYDYEKTDDFFYAFSEMYKSFPAENGIGISTIFISNKKNLFKNFEQPMRDRIPIIINFKAYTVSDLFQILKTTIEYAVTGKVKDSMLLQVAQDVANCTKSAREAKLLLYNLLTKQSFEQARIETDKDLIRSDITRLSFDQAMVLFSVIKRHEDINKMISRSNPGRYRHQIEPTAGSVYNIYSTSTEQFGKVPKVYKTFQRIADSLEKEALIKTDLKSLGRARGITTLIYPGESIDVLKPLVSETLKHRIEGI